MKNLNQDLPYYKSPTPALVSYSFREFLTEFTEKSKEKTLPLILGTEPLLIKDIYHSPNLLLAGITASGKTQFIYNQIASWLYIKKPSALKLIFCGSKSIDYPDLLKLKKHFIASENGDAKIVTPDSFLDHLFALEIELDKRIELFNKAKVKTIKDYNIAFEEGQINQESGHRYLPDIVLTIDDLYNFISNEENRNALIRLTHKNTHTGIYVIAVTSQISSNLINNQLKGNFTFRIALKLMSQNESKRILDSWGAEQLITPGEVLYHHNGSITKSTLPFIRYDEFNNILDFVGNQIGYSEAYPLRPTPLEIISEFDPNDLDYLFSDAARLIVMHQQGSTSLIQRKLKLGYNRAGRIIDQLEQAGIVGPFEGSNAREVFIPDEYSLEQFLHSMSNDTSKKVTAYVPPFIEMEEVEIEIHIPNAEIIIPKPSVEENEYTVPVYEKESKFKKLINKIFK